MKIGWCHLYISFTKEKGGDGYEYFRNNIFDDNVRNVSHIVSLLDYYNNQVN